MKIMYQPPFIVQKLFSEFIWKSSTDKILVTFDDGPNPSTTEKILITLRDENIKALFFCVGNNIEQYSQLVKTIIDEGHTIGNHTFGHKIITKLTNDEFEREISLTNQKIEEVSGNLPKYFRPPHGRFPFGLNRTLREYNLKNVMWSLLTYDYKNDSKVLKFAIKNYLAKNSIVVLHDSDKSAPLICDAIKYLADEAGNKNFQFGTPEECMS
ncbi:MAG: polysaccharide deacetylase family protein [Ignavibacteriaceae bacterium]|nr:polysaccharide deacetylase family protein [Ignavibacteriaceae bacterium]